MIVGLGVDIVEVSRIAEAMKNPRFIERILTPREREIYTSPTRLAGRWAAKEAVAKAVGLSLSWQDVEILSDEMGQPVAHVASKYLDPVRLRLKVSISHERGNAVAVAILERLTMQIPSSLI